MDDQRRSIGRLATDAGLTAILLRGPESQAGRKLLPALERRARLPIHLVNDEQKRIAEQINGDVGASTRRVETLAEMNSYCMSP